MLTVRNLPDEVHRALRIRAAQHGHSMEAEAREILAAAVAPEGRVKLGSLLAEHVYHVPTPKVALLNIGEEEKKGDILRQATFELMKEQSQYVFAGNVEGRDVFTPKADVMVCDGFTGNVVLKVIEGFHDLLEAHGVDDPFLHRFNYENYGGLPVLGVNGNVIIGHGISNDIAIKSMVLATREVVLSKLNDRIREALV